MSKNRLEVCQGHDCFGAGGGATLIELEELVQEYGPDDITIVLGGCRNFCGVGPNVHYNQQQHFTKVKGVDECQSAIESICGVQAPTTTTSLPVPIATRMMLKRATRERWQCLRQMARFKAKKSPANRDEVGLMISKLDEYLLLERKSVKTDLLLQDRANRRGERLKRSMERIIVENSELSDDSDSDGSEDESKS